MRSLFFFLVLAVSVSVIPLALPDFAVAHSPGSGRSEFAPGQANTDYIAVANCDEVIERQREREILRDVTSEEVDDDAVTNCDHRWQLAGVLGNGDVGFNCELLSASSCGEH